jgi:surface polysaccharide O-acyltransferase-like enzyme
MMTTRLLWADIVRVYSVFAVILLHAAAVPNTSFDKIPLTWWWQTNIYTAIVSTCIPLLVMLSGALLLTSRNWDVRRFVRRRLTKVLVPLLPWSLVYAGWRIYFWGHNLTLSDLIGSLIGGMGKPIFPHLWFMYLIISLYLLVPFLRIYVANASVKNQLYFLGLWFFASTIRPIFETRLGIPIGAYTDPVFGYIGYFLLGATFVKYGPDRISPRWAWACWLVLAGCAVVTMFGTYLLSVEAGTVDKFFYDHFSPTVILMSVATFVLLRNFGAELAERADSHPKFVRRITYASELSYGVYLVHALVIVILESGRLGFTVDPMRHPPLFAAPIVAVVVSILGLLVTGLLRRVRILKWLVP